MCESGELRLTPWILLGEARDVATLRVPTESIITRSKSRDLLEKQTISSLRVTHVMIQQE